MSRLIVIPPVDGKLGTDCKPPSPAWLSRRKLNLKAKLESRTSCCSFKRLVPASRRFQLGFHWFKLHRLTFRACFRALWRWQQIWQHLSPGAHIRPLLTSTLALSVEYVGKLQGFGDKSGSG